MNSEDKSVEPIGSFLGRTGARALTGDIAVVGAGAIGAVYGSMLHEAFPERVRFLADERRVERLSADGIVVNGKHHAVVAQTPDQLPTAPDVIIVTVKYHHLREALPLIEAARGKNTMVLSLLNGIDSEEIIAERIGFDHVLYGMALGIDAVRTAGEVTCSTSGRIFLGRAHNEEIDETVAGVRDLLNGAGINTEVPADMLRMLWWKFMINIGMNQVSAVLGAPYREFQENDHATALTDRAMGECVAVASAEGIGLGEADISRWHEVLNTLSPDGKTSMLQDVEAQRKTEVEMFAGLLTERARNHGLEVPFNEALFHMIKIREARYGLG
ncbi:MAG: ketopantoate reductase family protein [Spirochaetota bacterium]